MTRVGAENGVRGMFARFVHSQVASSIVLLACTLAAMLWANSPWAARYFDFTHTKVAVSWSDTTLALSVQHWINDLLMAVFFFVVGLEIKRELLVGHLSSVDSRSRKRCIRSWRSGSCRSSPCSMPASSWKTGRWRRCATR